MGKYFNFKFFLLRADDAPGLGPGMGALFLVFSLLLVLLIVTIGTVARALFGESLGGGLGTVVVAVSCALISKRALSGAKGFEELREVTSFITGKFGTSFRKAN